MIKIKAFAKINLNLHIIPNILDNGFFPVRFINCQVDLFDEIFLEELESNIEIICDNLDFPKREDNLIFKAVLLFKKLINNKKLGVRIFFKKNIPIKAGLGGGSSDAATTIKGLMRLWKIKLNKNELSFLAEKLGKDVYYFLQGGLCEIAEDGSEVIPLLLKLPKFWLLFIIPDEKKQSTEWMYKKLDIYEIGRNIYKLERIKRAIMFKNKKDILENLSNDFESIASYFFPVINKIKSDLVENGAQKTLLAGSGLTVVGFFKAKEKAEFAFSSLKSKYKKIIISKTIN